ncbi:MAG: hypothetical protein M9921_14035 [Fimbriimonadaceae bacterium]|nr:hypothetical protein [Chthonomonadaceae bacterium]MCO5297964.1 hypothetical protein [Fimbriimonadaceae bacterium]
MRVGFEQADFGALAELWGQTLPSRFVVTPELLRANTVDSPLFDWGASAIDLGEDGPRAFVAVKRSANPTLFSGPDPDQAHLTCLVYSDPSLAVDLVARVKSILRDRGVYKLVFGADSRHFFPGCPSECTALRDFLIIEGFDEGGEVIDLERDLSDYEPPQGCLAVLSGWDARQRPKSAAGATTVGPIHEDDLGALEQFLEREFPGRWASDTMRMIAEEGTSEGVYGLFVADQVEGFAVTQREGQKMPFGGAVWHLDLGERWGSLGPIGVSKGVRGKGFGDALLGASLLALKEHGTKRCIIDWTTLEAFYGRHGFKPARSYQPFILGLE